MVIRSTRKLFQKRRDPPKAKLGYRASPLAAFFQALGQEIFGERWSGAPDPTATEPDRDRITGPISRTMQVVEQMRLSLQTEEITAALDIYLPIRQSSEDDEAAFDDDEDAHRHYIVAADAWMGYWPASVTNWPTSEMRVRAQHIQVAEGKAPRPGSRILGLLSIIRPDLRYQPDHVLHAKVVILRDEAVLRALLPLASLPSPGQVQRFRSFQNRLFDELVAAA